MNTAQIFIAVTIVVLLIVALLVFFVSKERKANRLTPLAGLAVGFVVAGIAFGDNRFISYSLFAVGVILAVIDAFNRSKSQ